MHKFMFQSARSRVELTNELFKDIIVILKFCHFFWFKDPVDHRQMAQLEKFSEFSTKIQYFSKRRQKWPGSNVKNLTWH